MSQLRSLSVPTLLLLASTLGAASLAAGCGSGTGADSTSDQAGALGGGGSGSGGASQDGGGGAKSTTVSGFSITTKAKELAVTLGTPSGPIDLAVVAKPAGAVTPKGLTWTSSNPDIATVDSKGVLVATGNAGGDVVITVSDGTHTGSITLHVTLTGSIGAGTLPEGASGLLDAGTSQTSGGPSWEYPEDETMFPARMTPPTFQWDAQGNVAFRLVFQRGKDVTLSVYTDQDEYQPTPAVWRTLTNGGAATITLDLEGKAELTADSPRLVTGVRSISTADAELSGDVYFFPASAGKTNRLNLEEATTEGLYGDDTQCRSCHSVSRDGALLSFEFTGANSSASNLVRTNDSGGGSLWASNQPWNFSTFSPDGKRLLAVQNGKLTQYSVSTGAVENTPDADVAWLTQPSWSVDGSRVALIAPAPSSDHAFTGSTLQIASWDRDTKTLGAPTLLNEADEDASRVTLSAPSWSPDSRYLAVNVSDTSYAPTSAVLALVDVETKTRRELTRGGSSGVDFSPSFAPRAQGGLYWLMFTSKRHYGHESTVRQLWVMAIDPAKASKADASYPAFWVPGQATAEENLIGQWAPNVCAGDGSACTKGGDCCGGLSCLGDAGDKTCQANDCAVLGEECKKDSDCCKGAATVCRADWDGLKVCQPPLP